MEMEHTKADNGAIEQSDKDKLDRSISSVHRGKRRSLASAMLVICSGTSLVGSHLSE